MKLLFPIAITALLFTACGNKDEKSEDKKEDKKEGWSDDDREKFIDLCSDKIGGILNPDQTKEACDCTLGKLEKEYSSYNDADRSGNEDKIADLMKECLASYTEGTGETGGVWGADVVEAYMNSCVEPLTETVGAEKAQAICDCGLQKLQAQYSNAALVESEVATKIGEECAMEVMNQ